MASKQKDDSSKPRRDERGRLLPGGTANPNGRPKGSKNKFTQLKDAFLEAFEEVGGKDFVVRSAKEDPKAFLTLMAKMLPRYSELAIGSEKKTSPIVIVSHAEVQNYNNEDDASEVD